MDLRNPEHGHHRGDRTAYLTYVVPGILIMTVASTALGTSLSVAADMTEGIIDRFRTMAIVRGAVLTGHVVGSLIQTIIGLAIVLGVALRIPLDGGPAGLDGHYVEPGHRHHQLPLGGAPLRPSACRGPEVITIWSNTSIRPDRPEE